MWQTGPHYFLSRQTNLAVMDCIPQIPDIDYAHQQIKQTKTNKIKLTNKQINNENET